MGLTVAPPAPRGKDPWLYEPRGNCLQLFKRKDKFLLLDGPAGTGKSRAALEKLNALCEHYPGIRCLMVRKTRASLTQAAVVTFENLVLNGEHRTRCPFSTAKQAYVYPNGSIIAVGGLDKATKVMSTEWDVIYIQEATEMTEEEVDQLTLRTRYDHMPYQQVIADCNPGPSTHFLKQWFDSGRIVRLQTYHRDNPVYANEDGTETDKGKKYLDKLRALSGVMRDRFYEGIWRSAAGMVYTDWNPDVHMVHRFQIPRDWSRYWAVDFGHTHPFVWQAWAEDGDGRLYRYREIYRTETLVEDHAREILRICEGEPKPRAIICDHDAEGRATLERHLDFETLPAYKAVIEGIQAVQKRLRKATDDRPRIMLMRDSLVAPDEALADVHLPTCTEQEIEAYVWDTRLSRGVKVDEPMKKFDHGCDAMRYLVAFVDDLALEPFAPEGVVFDATEPERISPF